MKHLCLFFIGILLLFNSQQALSQKKDSPSGFLKIKKEPQLYATARRELVSTAWTGAYIMGTTLDASYVDMIGVGAGLTGTYMVFKYFSFTAFGEGGFYQGYKGKGNNYIYNEKQVHTGLLVNIYPHALWGGLPEKMLIFNAGLDVGMRFLDAHYPQVKPIDRTLGLRWGLEVLWPRSEPLPLRDTPGYTGSYHDLRPMTFISLGFMVTTPAVRYGSSSLFVGYLKFSFIPLAKVKKVIAPYYRKI